MIPELRYRFARLDPESISWRRVLDVNDRCEEVCMRGSVWGVDVWGVDVWAALVRAGVMDSSEGAEGAADWL